jgi:hypothetical protein
MAAAGRKMRNILLIYGTNRNSRARSKHSDCTHSSSQRPNKTNQVGVKDDAIVALLPAIVTERPTDWWPTSSASTRSFCRSFGALETPLTTHFCFIQCHLMAFELSKSTQNAVPHQTMRIVTFLTIRLRTEVLISPARHM